MKRWITGNVRKYRYLHCFHAIVNWYLCCCCANICLVCLRQDEDFSRHFRNKIYGNMSKLRGFACWWAMPWLVDVIRRLKSTAPVSQNDCLVVNYNELGAPATWFTLYDIHIHFHPFTHICSFLWPAFPPKLALKVNVSKQKANFGRKVGLKNAEVIMHLDV